MREAEEALRQVGSGNGDVASLIKPVTLEQMKDISLNLEVMPQKSTDFIRKLFSGSRDVYAGLVKTLNTISFRSHRSWWFLISMPPVAFFRDLLSFTVWTMPDANYAYVHRENVGFRLLQSSPGNEFIPGNRRFAHYIDVKDVDALYAELKPKLDMLLPGDVHGPEDKNYGQRELLILAPDGNLLAFGHAIFNKMVKEEPAS